MTTKWKMVNVRMPEEDVEKLKKIARDDRTTISQIIRALVLEKLKKVQEKQ